MEEIKVSEIIEKLKSISVSKESVNKLCSEYGITSKDLTISLFDKCLSGLSDIRNKINNDEDLENEDWLEVAIPFSSMVNILANHWYKDEK